MRHFLIVLVVILSCATARSQRNTPVKQSIGHVKVCKNLSRAVVQIDTDVMHGSGFVADADGYIVTALHVVADLDTLRPYENITVRFEASAESVPAQIVSTLDGLARIRDFAVLKINRANLFSLTLGNEDDAVIGSSVTIIGLPLSAMFPASVPVAVVPHFCLTGTISAQTSFPIGQRQHLDTIYFQGVSIKGISGAPIISEENGNVIGIVDTRMTGISHELADLHKRFARGQGRGITISGIEPAEIDKIIVVLDEQIANGLGTGTGAADIAYALKKAKRDRK